MASHWIEKLKNINYPTIHCRIQFYANENIWRTQSYIITKFTNLTIVTAITRLLSKFHQAAKKKSGKSSHVCQILHWKMVVGDRPSGWYSAYATVLLIHKEGYFMFLNASRLAVLGITRPQYRDAYWRACSVSRHNYTGI